MDDRVSLNPGRVLVTPEGGGTPYYATLTRADNPTQEGTPLNKANLLRDATANMYGKSGLAVPNDIFEFIGKYNLHWWKRRRNVAGEIPAGYTLLPVDDVSGDATGSGSMVNFTATANITYGSSLSVADDGTVSIVGAQTTSVEVTASGLNEVAETWAAVGLFFKVAELGDTIYYGATGCSFSVTAVARTRTGTVDITGVQEVEGYAAGVGIGEWHFVYSADRNAYPDSGIEDVYEYEYQGVPFENAVIASQVEIVSYAGTDTYGKSNPTSITFSFKPKLVFVYEVRFNERSGETYMLSTDFNVLYAGTDILIKKVENAKLVFSRSVTLIGSTLSWANSTGSDDQYNSSDRDYRLIAIG